MPPRRLTLEDLERLGPVEVEWTHKGETRRYDAIPMHALLESAGVEPGAMGPDVRPTEKRTGWKLAWIATASDGFQAAFSAAEVFPGMGPTDGEGSRCVRNLERVTILDLRRHVRE